MPRSNAIRPSDHRSADGRAADRRAEEATANPSASKRVASNGRRGGRGTPATDPATEPATEDIRVEGPAGGGTAVSLSRRARPKATPADGSRTARPDVTNVHRTSDQQAEAQIAADRFDAAVTAVTSAFGDPTRRAIFLFVRDAPHGVTASDAAEKFSLHPNVARHHLDKLAAGGYVEVDLARHESAGRPSKRYRPTPTGMDARAALDVLPHRDDLLGLLLARALERLPADEAAAMAESVGHEYGLGLASRMSPMEGHRSVKSAMGAVADALTAHGFAAHAEQVDDRLAIVADHCPFGRAATQFPHVVCAIDKGMVRGMLAGLYGDTDPRHDLTRPSGADHCVTSV